MDEKKKSADKKPAEKSGFKFKPLVDMRLTIHGRAATKKDPMFIVTKLGTFSLTGEVFVAGGKHPVECVLPTQDQLKGLYDSAEGFKQFIIAPKNHKAPWEAKK